MQNQLCLICYLACRQPQKGVVIQIITTVSLDSHSHASQTIDASEMVL